MNKPKKKKKPKDISALLINEKVCAHIYSDLPRELIPLFLLLVFYKRVKQDYSFSPSIPAK